MAKTKEQKQQMLKSYKQNLKNSTGIIVVSAEGLKPNDVTAFKSTLSEVNSKQQTVKNTIFKLALQQEELPELDTFNAGPNTIIYVNDDIAGTAKAINDFVKENDEKISIKAGILENAELTAEQVKELAEMPTKEQSVALIAGTIDQSLAGVVNVLEDSVRSIAVIIDQAYSEEKAS